jgi:hypothetical protein
MPNARPKKKVPIAAAMRALLGGAVQAGLCSEETLRKAGRSIAAHRR